MHDYNGGRSRPPFSFFPGRVDIPVCHPLITVTIPLLRGVARARQI